MTDAGVAEPSVIRASGGGTTSALWRQIMADVLGASIATVATSEGAAYGAALLAAVGVGWHSSVDAAVADVVRATTVAYPGRDVGRYAEAHARFAALYPALAPTFHGG
jgi:xylulokinase